MAIPCTDPFIAKTFLHFYCINQCCILIDAELRFLSRSQLSRLYPDFNPITWHLDCIFITLRLQWCNWNAIKTKCKILLHLSCSLIAFQLHIDCIFNPWYLDCCILIILRLQLYCNKSAILRHLKCNVLFCNHVATKVQVLPLVIVAQPAYEKLATNLYY